MLRNDGANGTPTVDANRTEVMQAMDALPAELRRFLHAAEGKWSPKEALELWRRGWEIDRIIALYRRKDREHYEKARTIYEGKQHDDNP